MGGGQFFLGRSEFLKKKKEKLHNHSIKNSDSNMLWSRQYLLRC